MSCVYLARPVTLCWPSTRRRDFAISLNSVPAGWTGRSLPSTRTSDSKISPSNSSRLLTTRGIRSISAAPRHAQGWWSRSSRQSRSSLVSFLSLSGADAGFDDVRVGAAAAEVPGDGAADVVFVRRRVLTQQCHDGHDLAGRAEAALEGVGVDERALHRMELAVLRDPLDGLDGLSFAGDGERHARVDGTAVDEDGARAARAFVADLLCSRQAERFAQRVEDGAARRRSYRDRLAVHRKRDVRGARTAQHGTAR